MFEDICLLCGKPLRDDAAYCSDECQSSDLVSPSVSSSSSALSSPSLGFAQGGDVPPLVPSALGSALRKFQRDPYPVSSSSASSNSWTNATDEDEDDSAFGSAKGCSYQDGAESISKSANFICSMMPAALSYTRRPSGINHHSTIPQVHQRSASGDSPVPSPKPVRSRGAPQSVPNSSHSSSATDDDEAFSECSLSSRDVDSEDYPLKRSSTRRTRDRASLPAYFTLLQLKSSKEALKTSPVSSSGNTVARPSPPTPKTTSRIPDILSVYDAPRGRRRNFGESPCSRQQSSPSRSRSRHVPVASPRAAHPIPSRVQGKGSLEEAFDVASPCGRTNMRRSGSPPPRMIMGVEAERSQSNSNRTRGRGRVPVQELDGVGCLPEAPGFGNGRSGLLDRGRITASAKHVPL